MSGDEKGSRWESKSDLSEKGEALTTFCDGSILMPAAAADSGETGSLDRIMSGSMPGIPL